MNREFLQLAHVFDPKKHGVAGWFVSEKLDGMRAYWDGGISRGKYCDQLAYANTTKDARLIERPIATGLWSRYAKVIRAPDWFLDLLPEIPLDGELYLERGGFQELISIIKQHNPDERWKKVKYIIFDSPGDFNMFSPGKINNPNCKMILQQGLWEEAASLRDATAPTLSFYKILENLNKFVKSKTNLQIANQTRLPSTTPKALDEIDKMLNYICDLGGEGLMLRKPESIWEPKRSHDLLKVKKLLDDEAIVRGYKWGKGKLEGLMGSMLVQWGTIFFELSGFTDQERTLPGSGEPGTMATVESPFFPIGTKVTFRYSEVSRDGVPLKARYLRKCC